MMPSNPESKNAIKKAKRFEKIKESRRLNRKLKKAQAKQNKKNHQNPNDDHVSKKVAKNEAIERLKHVQSHPDEADLRVCIDLQYETLMIEKELVHLARQLSRVYGFNKRSPTPCHLTFSGLTKNSQTFKICCDKNDGFANYLVDIKGESVNELFEPEKIVYLTPDSDQVLEDMSKDKVYVIGGLVDDSVKKNSSLSFAKEQKIQTAKLPIEKFCDRNDDGTFKQILTINQVFEILLSKSTGISWSESFSKVLPKRIGFAPKE